LSNRWHLIYCKKRYDLYDIHGLYQGRADEGQDKHKVLEMNIYSKNKAGRGDEKKQPINAGILLLLYHILKDLRKNT
jgi:hypothetical protein